MSTLQHLTIDADSATAPFEQVQTQIAAAVAPGQVSAGGRPPLLPRRARPVISLDLLGIVALMPRARSAVRIAIEE